MQQTILALAAILIFSIYALSRHGADSSRERIAITAEMETAAAGLAGRRLQEVTSRAFDEDDINRASVRTRTNGLTARNRFGPDTDEFTEVAYDDVDDFHGTARDVTSEWNGSAVAFRDSVSVRYFDPANPTSNPPFSLAKEVTVYVRALPAGFVGSPPLVARLRRVVTPSAHATHFAN